MKLNGVLRALHNVTYLLREAYVSALCVYLVQEIVLGA